MNRLTLLSIVGILAVLAHERLTSSDGLPMLRVQVKRTKPNDPLNLPDRVKLEMKKIYFGAD
jgi:hypothetical protein